MKQTVMGVISSTETGKFVLKGRAEEAKLSNSQSSQVRRGQTQQHAVFLISSPTKTILMSREAGAGQVLSCQSCLS